MSFLVDHLAKKAGEMVADKVKSAFGGDDDKEKDDKDGGFLSIFKKDKDEKDDEDDRKGGLFSFGRDRDEDRDRDRDRDRDDDKGNFFKKIFNRDDDDDDRDIPKKTGFAGLFSEQGPPGSGTFEEGGPGSAGGGDPCSHMREEDLDMMGDLLEVAKESS